MVNNENYFTAENISANSIEDKILVKADIFDNYYKYVNSISAPIKGTNCSQSKKLAVDLVMSRYLRPQGTKLKFHNPYDFENYEDLSTFLLSKGFIPDPFYIDDFSELLAEYDSFGEEDIFQYFAISEESFDFLKEYTDCPLFSYRGNLLLGIPFYGLSWALVSIPWKRYNVSVILYEESISFTYHYSKGDVEKVGFSEVELSDFGYTNIYSLTENELDEIFSSNRICLNATKDIGSIGIDLEQVDPSVRGYILKSM